MRVVSYNIRKAVGLDWRRDPHRIVDVLAEIDADVVVLQEADKRIGGRDGVLPLDRLRAELDLICADVSIRPLSHGWHGNAILLKNRFADHTHPQIEIIGVHLGLTTGMRRKQILALQDQLHDQDHPVLLAGDFNEWNANRIAFKEPATVVSPGPSFHAVRPKISLDRFVLSSGLRMVSSHVHHSALSRRSSDHLPIVIDFELTGKTVLKKQNHLEGTQ